MPPDFQCLPIMQGDVAQLDALFASASAPATSERLRKNTNEKFFARLFNNNGIDETLLLLVDELKIIFTETVAARVNFYCEPNHPLRILINYLLTHAATWYPRDAKSTALFYDKLSHTLKVTRQWASDSKNTAALAQLHEALNELLNWSAAENKRATMLTTRLCESELNHLKIIAAECKVLDLLNNTLTGKTLPNELQQSLSSTLKNELQHCVITNNENSPFLQKWYVLLPILAQVFTPNNNADDDQQLYRKIPALLHELERSLQIATSNPEHYRQFVEDLSYCLMQAVQKKPLDCIPFVALAYPEGFNDKHTRVIDSVLQQATAIQQEDWILFSGENNQTIRCKLALKNTDIDQLLFVDHTGRKVMTKTSKDFSLCISTGIAKPLTLIQLDSAIAEHLEGLIELNKKNVILLQQKIQIDIDKKNHIAKKQQEADALALEQQRLVQAQLQAKAQAEHAQQLSEQSTARKVAARKAMAEAREFAEEKQRRNEQQALIHEAELHQIQTTQAAQQRQQQEFAQKHIHALNVGAWVELQNDKQQMQRCKLGVIIAATGKYIFVDNLGRKVGEYQREQLITAYIDNQLTLINNGDKFEDQLVKVIRGLRKDVS